MLSLLIVKKLRGNIMLEKLIIKNFKTFKNETVIEITKTNYTILPQNVSENGVLKGTVIIGPNASGKSSVLEAIKILLDFLFKERPVDSGLFKCLFSNDSNFSLKYYFRINNQKIIYYICFDVSKKHIIEKLSVDNDENIIVERNGIQAVSRIVDKNGISYGKDSIDNETLFLRTLYFNTKFAGNETLKQWMDFLQSSVYIDAVSNAISYYGKESVKLSEYLKNNGTDVINEFFNKMNFKYHIEYSNISKGNINLFKYSENTDDKVVFFKRNEIEEPIPFVYESMGNKNLLKMLPAYLHIISGKGMLLIDEFSSGFHPFLEKTLLKYFMKNACESQFIFVSHSVSLVSNSIMRPDQVYAVEFEGKKGSKVIRFSDFQPRTAQNVEKMYLAGIFGALPEYEVIADDAE